MTLQTHEVLLPQNRKAKTPSHPPLSIRPARREDMPMIAGFVRSSAEWYEPFLDEKDLAEHFVDESWEEENYERRDFYVGYAGEEAVGTISLQYFGRHAYLGYIYLDASQTGRGYGQTLIKFAEKLARKMGMVDMILIAHPQATWAKRAYLKYGFEIIEKDRERILAWEGGVMKPYYEEGFELYRFTFDDIIGHFTPQELDRGQA